MINNENFDENFSNSKFSKIIRHYNWLRKNLLIIGHKNLFLGCTYHFILRNYSIDLKVRLKRDTCDRCENNSLHYYSVNHRNVTIFFLLKYLVKVGACGNL